SGRPAARRAHRARRRRPGPRSLRRLSPGQARLNIGEPQCPIHDGPRQAYVRFVKGSVDRERGLRRMEMHPSWAPKSAGSERRGRSQKPGGELEPASELILYLMLHIEALADIPADDEVVMAALDGLTPHQLATHMTEVNRALQKLAGLNAVLSRKLWRETFS